MKKIVPHPDSLIDINIRMARVTVATSDGIRLGWLLGADWITGPGQHIIRLDGDDFPTRHLPANVQIHNDSEARQSHSPLGE